MSQSNQTSAVTQQVLNSTTSSDPLKEENNNNTLPMPPPPLPPTDENEVQTPTNVGSIQQPSRVSPPPPSTDGNTGQTPTNVGSVLPPPPPPLSTDENTGQTPTNTNIASVPTPLVEPTSPLSTDGSAPPVSSQPTVPEFTRKTKREPLILEEFFSASLYKIYIKLVIAHMTMKYDDKNEALVLLNRLRDLIKDIQGNRKFKLPDNLYKHPLYKLYEGEYFKELSTERVGKSESESEDTQNGAPQTENAQPENPQPQPEYTYKDKFFEERDDKLVNNLTKFSETEEGKKFIFDTPYIKGPSSEGKLFLDLQQPNKINTAIISLCFILDGEIEDYFFKLIDEVPPRETEEQENTQRDTEQQPDSSSEQPEPEINESVKEKLLSDIESKYKQHINTVKNNKLFTEMLKSILNENDEYKNIVKHMDSLRQLAKLPNDEQLTKEQFSNYMKYCLLEESFMQLLPYIRIYYSSINDNGDIEYAPKLEQSDTSNVIDKLEQLIRGMGSDKLDINQNKQTKRDEMVRKISTFASSEPEPAKALLTNLTEKIRDIMNELYQSKQLEPSKKSEQLAEYRASRKSERENMTSRYQMHRQEEDYDWGNEGSTPGNNSRETIDGPMVANTEASQDNRPVVVDTTKSERRTETSNNKPLPPVPSTPPPKDGE